MPSFAACSHECHCRHLLLPTSLLLMAPVAWSQCPASVRVAALFMSLTSVAYHSTHHRVAVRPDDRQGVLRVVSGARRTHPGSARIGVPCGVARRCDRHLLRAPGARAARRWRVAHRLARALARHRTHGGCVLLTIRGPWCEQETV
mgnify:CR=1 FL=1